MLAGAFTPPPLPLPAGAVAIAVDGGMRHAATLGIRPQWWLGDFDSSNDALAALYPNVPRLPFPADKDETDFELALAFVQAHWPRPGCLTVIGGAGGEADHAFANLWVLPRFGLPVQLLAADGIRLFAAGASRWRLHGQPGDGVSVFALSPLQGLSYQGLCWPAADMVLPPFVARAARNSFNAKTATISWQNGAALIFLPPQVQAQWLGT